MHVSRNLARRDLLADELERLGRHVSRRDQGRRDRRRRGACALARCPRRARRQRGRRARARRADTRAHLRRYGHDAAAPDHAAAARGRARAPVLARPDGPRAHGGRRRPPIARTRSRGASATISRRAAATSSSSTGSRSRRSRRSARSRGARRCASCAVPGAARARPADRHPRRRRDRHRQVDRRDGDRVPPRDHARHVDGLHPADDARVLLARVHAVDPLLELRGVGSRCRTRRSAPRRLPRAVAARCSSASARSLERALQEGWSMVLEGVHLVPGLLPTAVENALVVALRARDLGRDGARAALLRPRRGHRQAPRR